MENGSKIELGTVGLKKKRLESDIVSKKNTVEDEVINLSPREIIIVFCGIDIDILLMLYRPGFFNVSFKFGHNYCLTYLTKNSTTIIPKYI